MPSRSPLHRSAAPASTAALALAATLALFMVRPAWATAVMGHSVEALARLAPQIVHGKVGQVQSRWDDDHRSISTYVEIRVTERLKGKGPAIILVRQPGGVVGEIGQTVAGAATFVPNEEVVLFLDETKEPDVFGVLTLAAGKVAFERAPQGELRAKRRLDGLALVTPEGLGPPRIWKVGEDDLGTPESFLERVRAAVAGSKRSRP